MNIAIIILSIIDTIMIYAIDIKLGSIFDEILIDTSCTLFFYFVGNYIMDENEKFISFFRYMLFAALIIVFLGILVFICTKRLSRIQNNFSAVIPACIAYFILYIKYKKEGF